MPNKYLVCVLNFSNFGSDSPFYLFPVWTAQIGVPCTTMMARSFKSQRECSMKIEKKLRWATSRLLLTSEGWAVLGNKPHCQPKLPHPASFGFKFYISRHYNICYEHWRYGKEGTTAKKGQQDDHYLYGLYLKGLMLL